MLGHWLKKTLHPSACLVTQYSVVASVFPASRPEVDWIEDPFEGFETITLVEILIQSRYGFSHSSSVRCKARELLLRESILLYEWLYVHTINNKTRSAKAPGTGKKQQL